MRQVIEDDKMGGEPYLKGTRVRVTDVAVKFEKLGYSVDEVLEAYPRLERSDVHTALSYFYDNEEDISASMDVEEAGAAV